MKKIALISAVSLISLTAISGKDLQFEKSLTMNTDRLSAVEFDLGSGSLNVVGTSGNEIIINATIASDDYSDTDDLKDDFNKKMQLTIERQSEYAMVVAKSKDQSWNWGKSKNIAINLAVELPRGLDLVIDDGSGSITIENMDGEITIDDGSGSITLRDIGNDVAIEDGSGSIQAADVNGDMIIDDGSGSIDLKNITGQVDIKDGSGSVMAKDIGGDFTIDDGSGDVVVKSLKGTFKLIDDGSGSIRVNGERWGRK